MSKVLPESIMIVVQKMRDWAARVPGAGDSETVNSWANELELLVQSRECGCKELEREKDELAARSDRLASRLMLTEDVADGVIKKLEQRAETAERERDEARVAVGSFQAGLQEACNKIGQLREGIERACDQLGNGVLHDDLCFLLDRTQEVLPVCSKCKNRWSDNRLGHKDCTCYGDSVPQDQWLRSVAENTPCRECKQLPDSCIEGLWCNGEECWENHEPTTPIKWYQRNKPKEAAPDRTERSRAAVYGDGNPDAVNEEVKDNGSNNNNIVSSTHTDRLDVSERTSTRRRGRSRMGRMGQENASAGETEKIDLSALEKRLNKPFPASEARRLFTEIHQRLTALEQQLSDRHDASEGRKRRGNTTSANRAVSRVSDRSSRGIRVLQRFKRFRERLNKSSKLWSTHIREDLDPLLDLVEEMQSLTEKRLSKLETAQFGE